MEWKGDLGGLGIWVEPPEEHAVGRGVIELGIDGQGDAREGDRA